MLSNRNGNFNNAASALDHLRWMFLNSLEILIEGLFVNHGTQMSLQHT